MCERELKGIGRRKRVKPRTRARLTNVGVQFLIWTKFSAQHCLESVSTSFEWPYVWSFCLEFLYSLLVLLKDNWQQHGRVKDIREQEADMGYLSPKGQFLHRLGLYSPLPSRPQRNQYYFVSQPKKRRPERRWSVKGSSLIRFRKQMWIEGIQAIDREKRGQGRCFRDQGHLCVQSGSNLIGTSNEGYVKK